MCVYICTIVQVYIPYQQTCHSVSFSTAVIFLQLYFCFFVQMSRMDRLALRARRSFDSDVGSEMCGLLLSQPVPVELKNKVLEKTMRGVGREKKGREEYRVKGMENRMKFNFKRFKKEFTHMFYIWKLLVCVYMCVCVLLM